MRGPTSTEGCYGNSLVVIFPRAWSFRHYLATFHQSLRGLMQFEAMAVTAVKCFDASFPRTIPNNFSTWNAEWRLLRRLTFTSRRCRPNHLLPSTVPTFGSPNNTPDLKRKIHTV